MHRKVNVQGCFRRHAGHKCTCIIKTTEKTARGSAATLLQVHRQHGKMKPANDIAALTPEKILAFARHTAWDLPRETDLCFFSCTNVRSAEIRQELSAVLKVPVITSNQCVIDFVRECCEQNA